MENEQYKIGSELKKGNNMRYSMDVTSILQQKEELQSMKMLQNVKFYNFFRDFEFPANSMEIKDFIINNQK